MDRASQGMHLLARACVRDGGLGREEVEGERSQPGTQDADLKLREIITGGY